MLDDIETRQTSIRELTQAAIPHSQFIPSYLSEQSPPVETLLFLHIPKCGGISLMHNLNQSLIYAYSGSQVQPLTGRVDDQENLSILLQGIAQAGIDFGQTPAIFTSHLPLQDLKKINPKGRPFTLLRDPIDRLLSEYSYDCMRADRLPAVDDFLVFSRKEANKNIMQKMINGAQSGQQLEDFIRQHFIACVDIKKMDSLLEVLLTRLQLNNVLMEPLNPTLKKYQLKKQALSQGQIEEVSGYNGVDIDLHRRFKAKPLLPEILKSDQIQRNTTIAADNQLRNRSEVSLMQYPTNKLFSFLLNKPSANFSSLKELVAHITR